MIAEELLLLDRQAVDRPLWRVRLEKREEPVMVEWALGRHMARWRDVVAKVKATPLLDPRAVGSGPPN